ncbi:MAG: 5,10-methylenetetrahydrofolate reductase [Verrucomicrobia subdivision 3 bacterium]|nr:5,10-methylenetetrahydrofolate reductase [Limisphaerales bacterium]MCS1415404.1 5,10-methylenetetrahydrofolate reductase [Limisphaerales bacterium]
MDYIRDIHHQAAEAGRPVFSIEFFPPKTEKGEVSLLNKTIPRLMNLKPDYCSVTYGAGGSTRDKTLLIVKEIQEKHGLTAMSHLTCVTATEADLRHYLDEARDAGIKNILALRGDPPAGTDEFRPTEGGFEYSYQLVELIRSCECFSIGVAGFPEGHIACQAGKHTDWKHLKSKADAGAEFVLTQLFFNNQDYFDFCDYVRNQVGVDIPICPGILPILSGQQIKRLTQLCGASIPDPMSAKLDALGDDDAAVTEYGIDYATQQCLELLDAHVPGLHFYCLNKAYSTTRVVENLGLNRS